MFKKILLALGSSTESLEVLAAGLTLAAKFDAEVLLLHIINPNSSIGFSPLVGGIFPLAEPLLGTRRFALATPALCAYGTRIVNDLAIEQYTKELHEYEQRGIKQLQTYAAQAQDLGVRAEISQNFGNAGSMICEVAKSWSADAIVMGRNQKSMMSEFLLGSTSNYVLHHAPCTVMVVQLPAV